MGNNKEIQRQQYNRTVAMLKQYRDAQFFLQHTTDEESKQRTEAAVQHITAALEEIQRRRQQAAREEEYTALCILTSRAHEDMTLAILQVQAAYGLPAYLTDLIVTAVLADIRGCANKDLLNALSRKE